MRILVTGAAGFLGRHLCQRLMQWGEEVVGLDLAHDPPVPGIEARIGSITDEDTVRAAAEGCEALIHTAAITGLWSHDPRAFERVNAAGTRAVLDACLDAGVHRAVHVSSFVTLITGRRGEVETVDERLELPVEQMLGPYPRSKRRAELICRAHPLDPVIVMPSAPIGPGDYGPTPPGRMLRDLAQGRLPALIDCTWNFVHIDALADGVIAALEEGIPGRRYLLAGENLETSDLARLASDLGLKPPAARVPYGIALAAGHVEGWISALTGKPPKVPLTGIRLAGPRREFDTTRAQRELGFEPTTTRTAFADALTWLGREDILTND